MTRNRGQFAPDAVAAPAPLLRPDACEMTRCARRLAQAAAQSRCAKRAAWVKAHCAALLADVHQTQMEAF